MLAKSGFRNDFVDPVFLRSLRAGLEISRWGSTFLSGNVCSSTMLFRLRLGRSENFIFFSQWISHSMKLNNSNILVLLGTNMIFSRLLGKINMRAGISKATTIPALPAPTFTNHKPHWSDWKNCGIVLLVEISSITFTSDFLLQWCDLTNQDNGSDAPVEKFLLIEFVMNLPRPNRLIKILWPRPITW